MAHAPTLTLHQVQAVAKRLSDGLRALKNALQEDSPEAHTHTLGLQLDLYL